MAPLDKLENQLTNQLKSAYKKYKTSIYYDNYSAKQRLELSKFENKYILTENKEFSEKYDGDNFFNKLARIILSEEKFSEFVEDIYNNINVIALPKKFKDNKCDENIIKNFQPQNNELERLYYFIDLHVFGHILGVLWILRYGYVLDDKLYETCYGNRLNTNLLENLKNKNGDYYTNDCIDFTPSLFNPYYKNYQSWRDKGLKTVNDILKEGKHAIMISMDLKEYYYRSLIDFDELEKDLYETKEFIDIDNNYTKDNKIEKEVNNRLTCFIKCVFKTYSRLFNRNYELLNNNINYEKLFMIPLGFTPSLIISNWYLQGFDQTIIENTKHRHYGRYVDDIIIVIDLTDKSKSHGSHQIENYSIDNFIKKYLTKNGMPQVDIFKKSGDNYTIHNQSFINANETMINFNYSALEIQKNKFNAYYFSHEYSNAMIENFQQEIRKNSSEFRLMHDLETITKDFKKNLYKIDYEESVNRIRDIKDVDLNKFEISKILSRLNWVSSDTTDKINNELINDLLNAFNDKIFDYTTLWEKIFSLLLINNKYDELNDLIMNIYNKCKNINVKHEKTSYQYWIDNETEILKNTLEEFLHASLIRVFALKYNKQVRKIITNFEKNSQFKNMNLDICYCLNTLMINNSLMKYPLQDLTQLVDDFNSGIKNSFDLNKTKETTTIYKKNFYPRFVKLHECILACIDAELDELPLIDKTTTITGTDGIKRKVTIPNPRFKYKKSSYYLEDYFYCAFDIYQKINFNSYESFPYIESECGIGCEDNYCPKKIFETTNLREVKIIKTIDDKKDSIKIGLINTKLYKTDYINRLKNKPNLTSKRFDKIKLLINEAINKKVDLLIMPEVYIPYEWVEKIVKISKDHQMAIIFGVEPIIRNNKIGNYVMTALPFIFHDKYAECALIYRLKNHYAPNELKDYTNHGYEVKTSENEGIKYYMYVWHGIHIVPYYCYEVASIEDRSIFKSCCDIVTVSEFNKDTKYFDNISESLSRDLFCYCIELNTSEYGGTSIIQPASSANKYLVRLKGGDDDYIVTQELDIKKLRTNARTKSDGEFKPKPPRFNHEIAKKKDNAK